MVQEHGKPRDKTRTWKLVMRAEMDRVVIATFQHTVTLKRTGGVLTAEVDGQGSSLARAVELLEWARVDGFAELIGETYLDGEVAA